MSSWEAAANYQFERHRAVRSPPNPYAVAEQLSGQLLGKLDGPKADEFLLVSLLNDKARAQFEQLGIQTLDDVLRLFARISAIHDKPLTLAKALESPLVRAASDAYGEAAIQKLLPFLLPITDAQFDGEEAPLTAPNAVSVRVDAGYADTGPLVVRNVSYIDPKQGLLNDCSLIAAMIALAWTVPARLSESLETSGYNPPQGRSFDWQFHEDDSQVTRVTATGRVPVKENLLLYAKSEPPGEFWPSLAEKAYVIRAMRLQGTAPREPWPGDYQLIGNSVKPWRACQHLAGGVPTRKLHNTDLHDAVFSRPGLIATSGKVTLPMMVMSTEIEGHNDTWHALGLYEHHAYAVLGKMRQSGHVVLRNPHGISRPVKNQFSDAKFWDCGEQDPVELNKLGVFAIEPELFNTCFKWAGWVNI